MGVEETAETRALLLADHPALELLDSTFSPGGDTHELIGDGRSFLTWLVDTGAVTEADARRIERRFGARELDEAAREARALRTFADAWIERWRARPGDAYEGELRKLNALLERASNVRRLERDGKRFIVETKRRDESPDELLAMLAGHV